MKDIVLAYRKFNPYPLTERMINKLNAFIDTRLAKTGGKAPTRDELLKEAQLICYEADCAHRFHELRLQKEEDWTVSGAKFETRLADDPMFRSLLENDHRLRNFFEYGMRCMVDAGCLIVTLDYTTTKNYVPRSYKNATTIAPATLPAEVVAYLKESSMAKLRKLYGIKTEAVDDGVKDRVDFAQLVAQMEPNVRHLYVPACLLQL